LPALIAKGERKSLDLEPQHELGQALANWENEPQVLGMNADFQWQFTEYFAINLDGHTPITLNSDRGGGFNMYSRVVAKKAEG
jgi:hypothetical protein